MYYTTRTLGQAFLDKCDRARMAGFAPLFAGSADAGRAALAALLVWITWIRRQYAFGGGRIMEQVHRVVLSTWTMTARAVSWRSDAVPGPCRSVRP